MRFWCIGGFLTVSERFLRVESKKIWAIGGNDTESAQICVFIGNARKSPPRRHGWVILALFWGSVVYKWHFKTCKWHLQLNRKAFPFQSAEKSQKSQVLTKTAPLLQQLCWLQRALVALRSTFFDGTTLKKYSFKLAIFCKKKIWKNCNGVPYRGNPLDQPENSTI